MRSDLRRVRVFQPQTLHAEPKRSPAYIAPTETKGGPLLTAQQNGRPATGKVSVHGTECADSVAARPAAALES